MGIAILPLALILSEVSCASVPVPPRAAMAGAGTPLSAPSTATPTATPVRTERKATSGPASTSSPSATLPPTRPPATNTPQPTATLPDRAQMLPTRIVIPSIHVDSPVTEVGWKVVAQGSQLASEWETADYAVGFHRDSALPGTVGNTVMSGHNNIKGEVFRDLSKLKPGDVITVYTSLRAYPYSVVQSFIVQERGASAKQQFETASWIAPTGDKRLTLLSCWPYTNNTHRVIVVAQPLGETQADPPSSDATATENTQVHNFIQAYAFKPQALQVTVGTTVLWTNLDDTPHHLVQGQPASPEGAFDSGLLASGQTFAYTFRRPGEYPYYCADAPFVTGLVEVVDNAVGQEER